MAKPRTKALLGAGWYSHSQLGSGTGNDVLTFPSPLVL